MSRRMVRAPLSLPPLLITHFATIIILLVSPSPSSLSQFYKTYWVWPAFMLVKSFNLKEVFLALENLSFLQCPNRIVLAVLPFGTKSVNIHRQTYRHIPSNALLDVQIWIGGDLLLNTNKKRQSSKDHCWLHRYQSDKMSALESHIQCVSWILWIRIVTWL